MAKIMRHKELVKKLIESADNIEDLLDIQEAVTTEVAKKIRHIIFKKMDTDWQRNNNAAKEIADAEEAAEEELSRFDLIQGEI